MMGGIQGFTVQRTQGGRLGLTGLSQVEHWDKKRKYAAQRTQRIEAGRSGAEDAVGENGMDWTVAGGTLG